MWLDHISACELTYRVAWLYKWHMFYWLTGNMKLKSQRKTRAEKKEATWYNTETMNVFCWVEVWKCKKKKCQAVFHIVPLDYTAQPKSHSFYHMPFISEHARAFVFIMHSINTCDFLTIVSWWSNTVEWFFFSLHCLSLQYIYKYIYTRSFLQLKSIIHMTFLTIKV